MESVVTMKSVTPVESMPVETMSMETMTPVKTVASMAPVAAMASTTMTSCNAWRGRNEEECKCEEGCYNCPAHTAYSVEGD